ncbi:MAG: metallophosphoesterase [Clostridia bacterium]|nr:metallophosphoesterase [Clostridia bacterium]
MKRISKALCVLLVALTVLPILPANAADGADATLRFGRDGKFKILLVADPQDDENLEETTTQILRESLDLTKPDLVIYLGDNTLAGGYEKQKQAIEAVTAPVRERNVPFAIVFGNHDDEFGVTKEELLEIYRGLGCLTYDAVPELHGVGNCNLPILSSDGKKTAFNLWLIDSGTYNTDAGASGYDYVHEDQLRWYKETAAQLAAENGGKVVPALDFQHIVIPEIYDKLYAKLTFPMGKLSQERLGAIYSTTPVLTRLNGYWLEQCCPPDVYDGQLDAWKEVGDVLAEFHGHDHNNSYEVNIDGIDVINVPSVGCNAYSREISRGVGLVTLDEADLTTYTYELIHTFDLALAKGSQIPNVDGGQTKAFYWRMRILDRIVMALFRLCRLYYRFFPEIL